MRDEILALVDAVLNDRHASDRSLRHAMTLARMIADDPDDLRRLEDEYRARVAERSTALGRYKLVLDRMMRR